MDTADKVNKLAAETGYELVCIGVPKTIDNDLAYTDHCPGYGNVAKYVATCAMSAGLGHDGVSLPAHYFLLKSVQNQMPVYTRSGKINANAAKSNSFPPGSAVRKPLSGRSTGVAVTGAKRKWPGLPGLLPEKKLAHRASAILREMLARYSTAMILA